MMLGMDKVQDMEELIKEFRRITDNRKNLRSETPIFNFWSSKDILINAKGFSDELGKVHQKYLSKEIRYIDRIFEHDLVEKRFKETDSFFKTSYFNEDQSTFQIPLMSREIFKIFLRVREDFSLKLDETPTGEQLIDTIEKLDKKNKVNIDGDGKKIIQSQCVAISRSVIYLLIRGSFSYRFEKGQKTVNYLSDAEKKLGTLIQQVEKKTHSEKDRKKYHKRLIERYGSLQSVLPEVIKDGKLLSAENIALLNTSESIPQFYFNDAAEHSPKNVVKYLGFEQLRLEYNYFKEEKNQNLFGWLKWLVWYEIELLDRHIENDGAIKTYVADQDAEKIYRREQDLPDKKKKAKKHIEVHAIVPDESKINAEKLVSELLFLEEFRIYHIVLNLVNCTILYEESLKNRSSKSLFMRRLNKANEQKRLRIQKKYLKENVFFDSKEKKYLANEFTYLEEAISKYERLIAKYYDKSEYAQEEIERITKQIEIENNRKKRNSKKVDELEKRLEKIVKAGLKAEYLKLAVPELKKIVVDSDVEYNFSYREIKEEYKTVGKINFSALEILQELALIISDSKNNAKHLSDITKLL